ncbi:NAD(P)H-dependent flavin oxidoreductase [Candidatus Desulfovibrio trichonymphae]|uniref:Nitronate monooxygenase n=1 Tax=Candidatus Desulfovibrio trichonymphae TaxID=1725232 RepID=A0A1J1DSM8_9BACT|nr:nitronate monooxygenase [Candidatus Desulfovibrio trichonymphae]BAV91653.1 nitronate monooxygenase [Candidatus Desulfovibrio trichonymphae]GHU91076.1 2-nitropropane dioxygenase [Deltaproteobacteria bacterium]GHU94978.1 2-nitropropane dioxygenase [Deltaproteobacteria bacterium]GHU98409.1 2-nitropropane dioxygenase [Deltaproteobacteria bacterium]
MSFPSLKIGDLTAQVPVIQGGMGVGISLSRLASAVANQGGIGVIAGAMIGMHEPDVAKNPQEANNRALQQEILKARALTTGIIGVNIMVALTTFSQMVRTAIENRADIIFAGAGMPTELPRHLLELCETKKQEFKTKLVPIVSSARAATILAKKWLARCNYLPDAFVVEGPKAGGHLGFKPENIQNFEHALENLVPQVLEAVKPFEDQKGRAVPVIAAGGVYTGADIRQFLDLGAAGVQMGTRFVATHECDADERFKQSYLTAKQEDVTIIKSPVGMPGRAILNEFITTARAGLTKPFKCIFHCVSTCQQEKTPYCIAQALINAMKGNLERGFAFCGANVFRVNKIISVRELMESLQREFDETVSSVSKGMHAMMNAGAKNKTPAER